MSRIRSFVFVAALVSVVGIASADTLRQYAITGQATTALGTSKINGQVTVDRTIGLVDTLDFGVTGLGAFAPLLTVNEPGLQITNPAPGDVDVMLTGQGADEVIAALMNYFPPSTIAGDPLLGDISGTYSAGISTVFANIPIIAATTVKLTLTPEPRMQWLTGGLLGMGLLYGGCLGRRRDGKGFSKTSAGL